MRSSWLLFLPCLAYTAELDVAKVSEALGHIIGKSLDTIGLELDYDAIAKGLKEEAEGKSAPLNEEECAQVITVIQEQKIAAISEQLLQQADALSNGDRIDENRTLSTPDSPKYR